MIIRDRGRGVKLSIFLAILIALLGIALTSAAAPLIGVGYGEDFLLYQLSIARPRSKPRWP